MSEQALTTIVTGGPVDVAISGWLDNKFQKTQSQKTQRAYKDTLQQFRLSLFHLGLDLNMLSAEAQEIYQGMSQRQMITLTAQKFASWSAKGRQVTATTHNQRIAILSSFYEYAILNDFLDYNPIKKIGRAKVQQYKTSKALTTEQTAIGLDGINRETLRGKRDYAIVSILLATGRRVSEVASLTYRNVEVSRAEVVTLNFPDLKGGKEISDILDMGTSQALLSWLRAYYGDDLEEVKPEAPLWISLAEGGRQGKSYGLQLSVRSFSDICKRHLHITKVHRTRHTWTANMIAAGAPLPLIKKKLGHSSLATTGIYAESLESVDNPYVEEIAKRAGIKQ